MEAPVPQASWELAGRHCHSMGGGAYYGVDPCVCGDMACHRRIVASGNRLHRGRSHRPGAELRRADGRAGRSRVPTGRDAPGAADRTLQAQQRQEARESATGAIGGGQVTMNEALLLAGPSPETGRAYTQQEFELRERFAPGSPGTAEPVASQFAGGSDLPATGPRQITERGGGGARPGRSDPRRGSGGALSSPWDVPGCDGKPGR